MREFESFLKSIVLSLRQLAHSEISDFEALNRARVSGRKKVVDPVLIALILF